MKQLPAWLRRFLAAGWHAPVETARRLASVQPVAEWTDEDRQLLSAFLRGPTGAKLLARARAMEAAVAIAMCRDVMHTQHSAGVSKGVSDAINWLESLSVAAPADAALTDSRPPEGEPDLAELLSP